MDHEVGEGPTRKASDGAARDAGRDDVSDTLSGESTHAPGAGRPVSSSALFAQIALEWKMLTREQVREASDVTVRLARMGMRRSFAQVARERRMLDEGQIQRIRREMVKRGVQLRIGDFELLGKLGEGSMGAVYRARQLSQGRVVALKVLRRELSASGDYLRRFQREAALASKVRHPNAVEVYETGQVGNVHYIVMEYVGGAPLSKLLAAGPMDEEQSLRLVLGVASALVAVHEQRIVHRDIKPENIMVSWNGVPKLMDLGIARRFDGAGASITRTGQLIGSPAYMSPEQCRGCDDLDARSDIYSLGATLFQMLCGRHVFQGESASAVMHQHVFAPLPHPKSINPKLSDAVCAILTRMLGKTPDERHADCAEVVREIESVLPAPPEA